MLPFLFLFLSASVSTTQSFLKLDTYFIQSIALWSTTESLGSDETYAEFDVGERDQFLVV